MSYKLTIAARAERDIDDFLTWLNDYNPATTEEYEDDLYEAIRRNVLPRPHTSGIPLYRLAPHEFLDRLLD